jgi:hypothetical protein
MSDKKVEITSEVQNPNHTEDEARRTQETINELKAALAARKAAKAAKQKD